VDGNYGSTIGYEPNSFGEWQEQPGFKEPPLALEGAADNWNFGRTTTTTTPSRASSSAS
jgi:catalase